MLVSSTEVCLNAPVSQWEEMESHLNPLVTIPPLPLFFHRKHLQPESKNTSDSKTKLEFFMSKYFKPNSPLLVFCLWEYICQFATYKVSIVIFSWSIFNFFVRSWWTAGGPLARPWWTTHWTTGPPALQSGRAGWPLSTLFAGLGVHLHSVYAAQRGRCLVPLLKTVCVYTCSVYRFENPPTIVIAAAFTLSTIASAAIPVCFDQGFLLCVFFYKVSTASLACLHLSM